MNKSLLLILLLIRTVSSAQSLDSLTRLINKIQKGENDSVRFASNEKFRDDFEKILLMPGSFSRKYDSLKNVSVIAPEDLSFRLYTWVVPHYDGTEYDYFGFLQIHSEKSDSLIPLMDSTTVILKPESEKLNPLRWFGAVYYGIVEENKSGIKYYTLMGWKGKDQRVTQKVIDVFYFNKGQPRFGFPIFKMGSVFRSRVIFSFSSQATMVLHFDKKYDGIVFDHLSTKKSDPGLISGPEGTYDALKWKKGKWVLFKDVDARTKWEPAENLPVSPEEK